MVKVKICGFKRERDVRAACNMGVDMIGINLVLGSPRRVTLGTAKKLFEVVPREVKKVAVLRPREPWEIEKVSVRLKPDVLQINPQFSLSKLMGVKMGGGEELILTISIPSSGVNRGEVIRKALEASRIADYILLDTRGPIGGGTGLPHDWTLSGEIRKMLKKPVFLAGGLTHSNVRKAIEIVRPYGVDVASGVESKPGIKDPELMYKFVKAVRSP